MSNLFSKVALGLSLTCALAMAENAFIGFREIILSVQN